MSAVALDPLLDAPTLEFLGVLVAHSLININMFHKKLEYNEMKWNEWIKCSHPTEQSKTDRDQEAQEIKD